MKNSFRSLLKLSWLFLAAFVIFTSCDKDDDDDNGNPPVLVEDGMYVKGSATALTDFDFKGLLMPAKNEVNQEEKATLLELYVAVAAGADGFNIVNVSGTTHTVYGPGTDFALVPVENRINDEPKEGANFWRGSYAETSTPFTVPEDGLYHVVIDTELGIVVVSHVKYWGLIGGATPGSWSDDTPMDPLAFDLNSMTFQTTGAALSVGEFKFRYSGGWKIVIDTEEETVRVNTNLGGAVDALVAGGDNIANAEAGIYTVEMVWTLGEGHEVTLTKTGEMGENDWTGVELDMVGEGVSADNATAIADPSEWGWGNVIYPDPNEPTVDGKIYTWTWESVILEADLGFKIRTKNGEAPAVGGANFDAGLESVDHENSSANVDAATSGDIKVSVKGAYRVVVSIDAADSDTKVITITEVAK